MTTAREPITGMTKMQLLDMIVEHSRSTAMEVFAELREKKKEGCTQVGSSSPSLSGPCSETSFDGGQTKIDEWEPTEEQIESLRKASPIHYCGDDERSVLGQAALRYTIREALIAGHRIAREDQCSQSGLSQDSRSSQSAQPSTTSVGNAASDTTTATAGTMHALQTPATEATTKSLDARAEALFAANPEWRPRSNDQALSLQFHEGRWTWLSVNFFTVDPCPATAQALLLAALLPKAIDKWTANGREVSTGIFVRCNGNPPRDLESAINILEGA